MEDGSVRCNVSWKCNPEGRNDADFHELQSAFAKMKKTRSQRCKAAWHVNMDQRQSWSETHVRMSTGNSSLSRNRQLVDSEIRRRWQGVET